MQSPYIYNCLSVQEHCACYMFILEFHLESAARESLITDIFFQAFFLWDWGKNLVVVHWFWRYPTHKCVKYVGTQIDKLTTIRTNSGAQFKVVLYPTHHGERDGRKLERYWETVGSRRFIILKLRTTCSVSAGPTKYFDIYPDYFPCWFRLINH